MHPAAKPYNYNYAVSPFHRIALICAMRRAEESLFGRVLCFTHINIDNAQSHNDSNSKPQHCRRIIKYPAIACVLIIIIIQWRFNLITDFSFMLVYGCPNERNFFQFKFKNAKTALHIESTNKGLH